MLEKPKPQGLELLKQLREDALRNAEAFSFLTQFVEDPCGAAESLFQVHTVDGACRTTLPPHQILEVRNAFSRAFGENYTQTRPVSPKL